ncbi:MAG: VCBS repeat-containing protein [Acidobacteria bacterium]|nr:VCBS repeat-containing protein [Acidobacteriota bacterium]
MIGIFSAMASRARRFAVLVCLFASAVGPGAAPAGSSPTPAQSVLRFREITADRTHRIGLPAIPFLKIALGDLDGDGRPELVTGAKDGTVSVYTPGPDRRWKELPGWADGVRANAFSAPALGDLDGDGRLDLLVGTGGFSKVSGRVLLFRNVPGTDRPRWELAGELPDDVGDDAAPALADVDLDGKPEVLVGNSEGVLRAFRQKKDFLFEKTGLPAGLWAPSGKYASPTGARLDGAGFLAVGISTGKVRLFCVRRSGTRASVIPLLPSLPASSFPSPAFGDLDGDGLLELLVADSDGNLAVWRSDGPEYRRWSADRELVRPGVRFRPSCAPAAVARDGGVDLLLGDQDGALTWLRKEGADGPWAEQPADAASPRVPGYSRPCEVSWKGRRLILVGDGSGRVHAFSGPANAGSGPWARFAGFPDGARVPGHATPSAMDLDGDGEPELVVGDQYGTLNVFSLREAERTSKKKRKAGPVWVQTPHEELSRIKSRGGFAVPAFLETPDAVWLFLGQQDGQVRTFSARRTGGRIGEFTEHEAAFPRFRENASPAAFLEGDRIRVVVGDRDGNLREFVLETPSNGNPPDPQPKPDKPE